MELQEIIKKYNFYFIENNLNYFTCHGLQIIDSYDSIEDEYLIIKGIGMYQRCGILIISKNKSPKNILKLNNNRPIIINLDPVDLSLYENELSSWNKMVFTRSIGEGNIIISNKLMNIIRFLLYKLYINKKDKK